MSTPLSILMIVTAHASLGQDGPATGVWFEELSTPYYAFIDAGARVEVASIPGGAVPIAPHSDPDNGDAPASVQRFKADPQAMHHLHHARAIDTLQAADYDAIFLPGGHGTMWDFPASTSLAALLSDAWQQGKVLSAVCHGPAGLLQVRDEHGQPVVANRRVSAFSNQEEDAAGLSATVPFALESQLRELGARYESGPDFAPFAISDGRLITGQNPASSELVAQKVLSALQP